MINKELIEKFCNQRYVLKYLTSVLKIYLLTEK